MRFLIMTGLLTYIAVIGDTYAQSFICPKPQRIEETSSADGGRSYTAKAPNGAIWQESDEPHVERDLANYEFAGALIEGQQVACLYKNKSAPAVRLKLQRTTTQPATPTNIDNWKNNECQGDKPASCAIDSP